MGDYVDAINLSDKRFDPDSLTIEYRSKMGRLCQEQTEEAIEILEPIKDRIIGLGVGNHEAYVQKHYHFDVMYRLCGVLNVKYLGWTSITRVRITREVKAEHHPSYVINIFAEHSHIAGRKKGGKINSIEDRSNDFDCDIYLRGHSHDKVCTTKTLLYMPKEGGLYLREKKRVYAICPSYYNAYKEGTVSYAEVAGYSPTSTGVVKIIIEVKHDGIDYHISQ
ncbi:hypothetical protein CCP1ISM_50019 [Azospirillaceae bacterium]